MAGRASIPCPKPVRAAFAVAAVTPLLPLSAAAQQAFGPRLEGFEYPFDVQYFRLESQGGQEEMAFLDLAPTGEANGRTALLLHGKNFCAATWEDTINRLGQAGWRVVAPDQIGFCKSTKPDGYQYSFDQLAHNTEALLASLGLDQATVIGHSMGGMLAARYAVQYPERVEQLVLVNPIGLEDWRAKGVPYATIETYYEEKLETTAEGIRSYQETYYYPNGWESRYDHWVEMAAGPYRGEGAETWAWAQAKTDEMVYAQPVVQDFPLIEAPTLLLIGELDTTAPGADRAPDAVSETLGNYPELASAAQEAIPDAELVTFPDLGHSPQIEVPERFHEALFEGLEDTAAAN
jgi:pimeloyl-ACP methyl ester carboxylesterase